MPKNRNIVPTIIKQMREPTLPLRAVKCYFTCSSWIINSWSLAHLPRWDLMYLCLYLATNHLPLKRSNISITIPGVGPANPRDLQSKQKRRYRFFIFKIFSFPLSLVKRTLLSLLYLLGILYSHKEPSNLRYGSFTVKGIYRRNPKTCWLTKNHGNFKRC